MTDARGEELAHRLFVWDQWDESTSLPRSSAFKDSRGASVWLDNRFPSEAGDAETLLHSRREFQAHGCVHLNIGDIRRLSKNDTSHTPADIDVLPDPAGAAGDLQEFRDAHFALVGPKGVGHEITPAAAKALQRYVRDARVIPRPPRRGTR